MQVQDIPNFEQMSDLKRVKLAEDLIASVRNPEVLPADPSHRVELEKRWSEFEKNPSLALSEKEFWEQVKTSHK